VRITFLGMLAPCILSRFAFKAAEVEVALSCFARDSKDIAFSADGSERRALHPLLFFQAAKG
jgi:hypothetical protein